MWLDLPVNSAVISQERLIISFSRLAIAPAGRSGQRCMPKMASTPYFSNTPLSHTSRAPPVVSSAGWNTSRKLYFARDMRSILRASSSSMAMWPSWPQACILPGVSEAKSSPVFSRTGSASASLRKAMARDAPLSNQAHTLPGMGENTSQDSGASAARR